jgi:hypothetical protein
MGKKPGVKVIDTYRKELRIDLRVDLRPDLDLFRYISK